jgi:tRNA(fMet)-specific endonuclease VapC
VTVPASQSANLPTSLHFLLDTNVLSEPLKPRPNARVMDRLQRHREEIATATLVWHELLFGCYRLPASVKRTAIERYMRDVIALLPMLSYDEAAAEWHAGERARLAALGKPPAFVDGQIAAIAQVNGLTLVTANVADYAPFTGVTIVDWTKA